MRGNPSIFATHTGIIDQPQDYIVLPGMAGRATGEVSTDPCAITISLSAVFTEEGGSQEALQGRVDASLSAAERPTFVWAVDESDMTVKRRQVVPDVIPARGMRLKEGITTGEWIVIAVVYSLAEGQQIRIREDGIVQALRNQNTVVDAGAVDVLDHRLRIQPTGQFQSPRDVGNLTVRPSILDVAQQQAAVPAPESAAE